MEELGRAKERVRLGALDSQLLLLNDITWAGHWAVFNSYCEQQRRK